MKLSKITRRSIPQYTVMPDYQRPHPQTSVGIEIELEGLRPYNIRFPFKRWKIVEDGSLRGGIELVSDPVWGSAIDDALEEISQFFGEYNPIISERTSVHVHVNILDMETEELIRFVNNYIMYEPALFRMHRNWDRENNIFCVPCYKSSEIQKSYSRLLYHLKRETLGNDYLPYKYAAMNPNSLYNLGTLEFRHMGGTKDVNQINQWINVLLQLKVSALLEADVNNLKDVFGEFSDLIDFKEEDLNNYQTVKDFFYLLEGE